MKKIFCFSIAVLILASALFTGVFAAEPSEKKTEDVKIVNAQIVDKDDKLFLSVTLKNLSETDLYDLQITFADDTKTLVVKNDDISFSENCVTQDSYGYGLVLTNGGTLKAGASKTLLFELNECKNKNTHLNLLLLFARDNEDTVVSAKTDEISFEDILNQEYKIDSEKNTGKVYADQKGEKTSKLDVVVNFLKQSGFSMISENWKVLVMLLISFLLLFLAIVKKFEPLLLLPIAFGMLLTNLPGAEMYHPELFEGGHVHWGMFDDIGAGLLDYLYLGIKLGIYPCLIFLGIGAMTDFGPLIANPKSLVLGAAAQFGIFMTYFAANEFLGFSAMEASSIGIIGGADGPTAIFVTSKLAPHLLGPIAVAAYSYMALVPFIQPPIMKLLTTKEERRIVMKGLRNVSKTEKMIFPIAVTVFVAMLVPSAAPLVGCLMLGNLMRESGVVDRIAKAAQNELMNIVTIFLGISVGATATAENFMNTKTLYILLLGVIAFSFGTAGGVLLAKFMNLFLPKGKKINPLIGSAGVSAVPMAARVSQAVGQKENPSNFLLMHAMGPNVAGVIGSAIAAGVLIALFA